METLTALLQEYGRFLELEDSVADWRYQRPKLHAQLREQKVAYDLQEVKWKKLEDPDLFTRLFGRVEEKKEHAYQACQEAKAAYETTKAQLEALDANIVQGQRDLEGLSGSQKAYEKARQASVLTPQQERQLLMEEIAAFTPAALETAERILEALQSALPWARVDARRRDVGSDNRKMACLSRAEAQCSRLLEILALMPEGTVSLGSYLQNPKGYLYGVTSEYAQLDRLNHAIEQVREVRDQLRALTCVRNL